MDREGEVVRSHGPLPLQGPPPLALLPIKLGPRGAGRGDFKEIGPD